MVQGNTFGFVERNQGTNQKLQVLFLERDSEPIDDTSQDLQKFPNTIVTFRFVDKSVKDVGDGSSDEGTVGHELSVDAVKNSFEIISLPGVFTVKEFYQLQTKFLIDILLGGLGIYFGTNNESQK